jgi:hypothetical protein
MALRIAPPRATRRTGATRRIDRRATAGARSAASPRLRSRSHSAAPRKPAPVYLLADKLAKLKELQKKD